MIGDVEAETFMIRLMLGVIGSACVLFLCRTCYNVSRINRHAAAEAKTKAERGARLADVFVCESYQDTAMAQEHGEHAGHDDQFWQQVDEQLRVQRDASVKRRFSRAVPDKLGPGPQSSTGPSRQCRLSMRMARWAFPPSGLPAALSSTHSSIGASRRSSTGKAAALAEPKIPPVPLLRWNCMTLSGPPGSSATVEVPADEKPTKHQSTQIDNNRFASPPLVVLATGGARVATIKRLRRCFMLHSVVLAATADALEAVLLEAAELRKLKHHCLLRMFAVVADQPYGEVGLLSELTTGSLAALLDTSPVRLTWANGLLAFATDVCAGLAHLHGLGLFHGRLFPCNVLITSEWRAKLSEYALGRYLALSHGGQNGGSGYHSLPSAAHGKNNLAATIFLPPEKFSGKIQGKIAAVQPQRLPSAMSMPPAKARIRVRKLATRQRHSTTNLTTPQDADEPRTEPKATVMTAATSNAATAGFGVPALSSKSSTAHSYEKPKEDIEEEVRLAEQHGDAWAFGCLIARLALHQKRTKEHPAQRSRSGTTPVASDYQHCSAAAHVSERCESSPPAAQASSRRLNRKKSDELDGWSEYESGSKDRPGRCADRQSSRLKLSIAEAATEGRPRGRRKSVDLKFQALIELSRALNLSRKSSAATREVPSSPIVEVVRRCSCSTLDRMSERYSETSAAEADPNAWPSTLLLGRASVRTAETDEAVPPSSAPPSPPTSPADASAPLEEGSTAAAAEGQPDGGSIKLGRLKGGDEGDEVHAMPPYLSTTPRTTAPQAGGVGAAPPRFTPSTLRKQVCRAKRR